MLINGISTIKYTSLIYWIASELLLLAMTEPFRVFLCLLIKQRLSKVFYFFSSLREASAFLVIARGVSPKQSSSFPSLNGGLTNGGHYSFTLFRLDYSC